MMNRVDNLMKQAVAGGVFPGGVLLISKEGSIRFLEAYGLANVFSRVAMTRETNFDLASLTKPLATAVAVMKLAQQAKIRLEQSLDSVLPEFKNSAKSKIKIKHLLYHNSGLPDYRPYYQTLFSLPQKTTVAALRQFLVNEPLTHPIGTKILYSDLGFMILRWVVERISGRRLDHFVAEEIYESLSLNDLFFVDLNSVPTARRFAATERCPWRRTVLEGQVHDENAYAVGGIEGHAGLFGTAENVNALLSELLSIYHGDSSSNLFPKELVRIFFRRLPKTDKALGFDMPSSQDSSCGKFFSKKSVGHLGFTGTSFWMELDRKIIVILLTNRVHPSRNNNAIKAFRPQMHDTVMQAVV